VPLGTFFYLDKGHHKSPYSWRPSRPCKLTLPSTPLRSTPPATHVASHMPRLRTGALDTKNEKPQQKTFISVFVSPLGTAPASCILLASGLGTRVRSGDVSGGYLGGCASSLLPNETQNPKSAKSQVQERFSFALWSLQVALVRFYPTYNGSTAEPQVAQHRTHVRGTGTAPPARPAPARRRRSRTTRYRTSPAGRGHATEAM
jgi:hypothetical protein